MQKVTPFLWFDTNAEEAMMRMKKIDVKIKGSVRPVSGRSSNY